MVGEKGAFSTRVLSEFRDVVKTKHIAFCQFEVEDGSVEPLPVVICEVVWCGY